MDPAGASGSRLILVVGPSATLAGAVSNMSLDSDSKQRNPATTSHSNGAKATRMNTWPSFHRNDNLDIEIIHQLPNVPATVFTLFPKLVPELRCKIWYWASHLPRIIEIERCPARDGSTDQGTHPEHRVCPKSRLPHAVLQVNHEARKEAMNVYEMRTFDSDEGRFIYFNPKSDIVYFGEKNCFATMIRAFMDASRNKEEISQVAIDVVKRCKSFDCPHDTLENPYLGVFEELRILHGFDNGPSAVTDPEKQRNGCPGLREVYFVVKSDSLQLDVGAIDASIIFRPATTDGMTKDQISKKQGLEFEVGYMRRRGGLIAIEEYKWSEDLPKIHFVSLASLVIKRPDYRIYSTMSVKQEGIKRLEQNNWSFVKRLESRTECHITIPENPLRGRRPLEIGFFGTKANVAKAKQAIMEKAMTYGDIQKWRKEIIKEPIKQTFEESIKCLVKMNRSTGELLIEETFVGIETEGEASDEKWEILRQDLVSKTKEELTQESDEDHIKDILTIALSLPQKNPFKGLKGEEC